MTALDLLVEILPTVFTIFFSAAVNREGIIYATG